MPMIQTYSEFLETLKNDGPEAYWPEVLISLWYDAKGNWEAAHDIVDGMNNATAKWVHAYLHRKEGDDWNAGYWYRQAGKDFPNTTLENEHREIVQFILEKF
ncbi:hypothetical protein [Maribacter sp. 2308TA10-17]|uniref:hypothetical protein n=1 Tax=Maribacter sp. 2308TA10-17 TaxID=3386276 RepID=UPI0039BC285D